MANLEHPASSFKALQREFKHSEASVQSTLPRQFKAL